MIFKIYYSLSFEKPIFSEAVFFIGVVVFEMLKCRYVLDHTISSEMENPYFYTPENHNQKLNHLHLVHFIPKI